MPSDEKQSSISLKDALLFVPVIGSALAMIWEVGSFIPIGGFSYFSLSEHVTSAIRDIPIALVAAIWGICAWTLWPTLTRKSRAATVPSPEPDEPSHTHSRRKIFGSSAPIFALGVLMLAFEYFYHLTAAGVVIGIFAIIISILVFFRPEVGPFNSNEGRALLFSIFPVLTLALAADSTTAVISRMDSTEAATVTTKSETFPGFVWLAGERGFLIYKPQQQIFVFERADEIKSVEWHRPKLKVPFFRDR